MSQRKKASFFYSIVSMALLLFLMGFFGATYLYTQHSLRASQEKIPVSIELKESPDSMALVTLTKALETADYVKTNSLKRISKDEKLKEFVAEYGQDSALDMTIIPFYESFEFNLKENYLSQNAIEKIKNDLKENNDAINDIQADALTMNEAANNVQRIALIAFSVALLFIFVAMTLIHNTIRLALFSDRFLIKNMELVGASWGFITRPYIRRSIANGLLSALLAVGALGVIGYFLLPFLPELGSLLSNPLTWAVVGGLILLGILISWLSTYYVVNKYLNMRLDDLY